jgi:uncharacterized ion transporter superfamily protein YfcC
MEKKKYGLLKIIGIAFLFYVILTLFIPAGSFSGSEFTKGDVASVGIYGLFTSPVYSFAVFAQYFILILCIGCFYAVLNKTGVYERIVSFFEKKNKVSFLVATVIIFALVTSIFGETVMIFILLPFFITVLLKLGFDKLSCLASTVGAGLIGLSASITGNLAIYKSYFKLSPKVFIIYNSILLAIFIFLLCMFILAKSKKSDSKKVKSAEIPLYNSIKNNKKSIVPLIVILGITLVLLVLGLFNWYYAFDMKIFNDLHEKLIGIQLFGINIVQRVFGTFSQIGYFSNYDVCAILLVSSFAIAWVYSIKFDELFDSFKDGAKSVLPLSFYVIFALIIFASVATSNSGNISVTISNFILGLSKDFNIVTGILTSIAGSFFYNDYLYFMNSIYGFVSVFNESMMPYILSVFQSIYGIMMFVLPVSITLIFGLTYLNVSYKEWLGYIWKFLVQIFAISIIGCLILSFII